MASSRVMPSSSSASPDLARQPSIYSPALPELQGGDPAAKSLGYMNMDDLLRNICSENAPYGGGGEPDGGAGEAVPPLRQGSLPLPEGSGSKTIEEMWQEISAERKAEVGGDGSAAYGEMTLEDYLAKAGPVGEEDVRVPSGSGQGGFAVDSVMSDRFGPQQQQLQLTQFPLENPILGFGNSAERGGGRGGRGRKRPVLDLADRATVQRQKRMIKNRESAARSRERKQAYTVELESLVTQLEEEHARLLREQEDYNKQRLKELMENLIPVTEGKKPPRALRRTCSMQW